MAFYAMAAVLKISELLCFICNKFGKCGSKNVITIVVDFYSEDDIWVAKELLHAELVTIYGTEAPRLITRKGNNRAKADVDDIISFLTRVDEADGWAQLPTFVATNPDRLPYVKPEDLESCTLAKKIASLEAIVRKHDVLLQAVQSEAVSPPAAQESTFPPAGPPTWADVAVIDGDVNDGFQLVQRKKVKPVPAPGPASPKSHVPIPKSRKLVGARSADDSKVRSVPRPLVAFVGRLHIDTTAEDLVQYLAGVGMPNAKCTKLSAKDGRTFSTSAFRVAVDNTLKDIFYNENNWPSGCELRDWVFRN